MQCVTARGQWAVELLLYITSLPWAGGRATPAVECLTARGQWATQLLQCTFSPPRGSGRATPAMYCLIAWGRWGVELLQYTASLIWGTGQWNSCNALPCCLGALGNETPTMHCLAA